MLQKISLLFWVVVGLLLPNGCVSQAERQTDSPFAIRIFSSANFMGYLEPCG